MFIAETLISEYFFIEGLFSNVDYLHLEYRKTGLKKPNHTILLCVLEGRIKEIGERMNIN